MSLLNYLVSGGAGSRGGVAAIAATDPATVANSIVGFDFSLEGGADASALSSVTDRSGNSRTATQATGAKQPTLKTNIWNGLKVARFDGGDGLATAAIDLTAVNALTIYAVFSATHEAQQMLCEFSADINSNNGTFYAGVGTARTAEIATKGTTAINTWNSLNTIDTTATARVVCFRTNMGFNRHEAYAAVDGEHLGTKSSASSGNNTTNYGNYALNIGARNAASLFLTGDVGEFWMFSGMHDAITQAGIEKFLATKWGVTAYQEPEGVFVPELDSLTEGGNTYFHVARPQRTLNRLKQRVWYANPSVSGRQIATAQTAIAEATAWSKTFFGNKNVATVLGGSNDMAAGLGNVSAATALTRLWTYTDALRAAGFKVPVGTVPDRTDVTGGAGFTARATTLNASIVSDYASHADALIDYAANTRLNDSTNATTHDADLVHWNTVGNREASVLEMTALTTLGFSEIVPTDISGLVGWWEADNPGAVYADGDPVGTWNDLSGSGLHATGTTTQRPTYTTNVLNGKPVMRFNGTSNGLITPALNLSGTNAITVIIVWGGITAGTQGCGVEMSTNVNSQTDSFILYRENTNSAIGFCKGNVGISSYNPTTTITTGYVVTSMVMDMSRTSAETFGWTNQIITGTRANDNNNTGNFGNRALYIGARAQASLFLAGDIASIKIYSGAKTGAERGRLEEADAAKYGLF